MHFLNKKDLEQKYMKAKKAFMKCAVDEENEFLQSEINIPINSIVLREGSITIRYEQEIADNYVIEIRIQLISPTDDVIGSYTCYENESGAMIDDSLVFI